MGANTYNPWSDSWNVYTLIRWVKIGLPPVVWDESRFWGHSRFNRSAPRKIWEKECLKSHFVVRSNIGNSGIGRAQGHPVSWTYSTRPCHTSRRPMVFEPLVRPSVSALEIPWILESGRGTIKSEDAGALADHIPWQSGWEYKLEFGNYCML